MSDGRTLYVSLRLFCRKAARELGPTPDDRCHCANGWAMQVFTFDHKQGEGLLAQESVDKERCILQGQMLVYNYKVIL